MAGFPFLFCSAAGGVEKSRTHGLEEEKKEEKEKEKKLILIQIPSTFKSLKFGHFSY
ncbi:hypothetical protein SLEP1_g22887 [Rubroshorea leprosula]|uniref:Uncharacterized protein n=1 Tax=Rubroshorea leprosula TaxID=152421 RepID=A0AAV5JK18_9ROSI|nr:hypothetical protein SLEP1_g22887 [Rubroshorea leprosula]